jgi:hypothetical protein
MTILEFFKAAQDIFPDCSVSIDIEMATWFEGVRFKVYVSNKEKFYEGPTPEIALQVANGDYLEQGLVQITEEAENVSVDNHV